MNDSPNPIFIVLGAIAALAILAILYVLQKRKEKQATPAASPTQHTSSPRPQVKIDPRTILSPLKSELFGRITSFDTGPEELNGQLPINMRFIRPLSHPDGGNYVLSALSGPLIFKGESLSFLVVVGHLEGTRIGKGMKGLPIKVAVVKDDTLVMDQALDFAKVEYVAIGFCDEISKEEYGG
jgi:hypothetical protein